MNDYLTIEDVAKLLRVSKPTVMRIVENQGMPVIRLAGRVIRFSRADVMTWLERQASPGPKKGGGHGGRAA